MTDIILPYVDNENPRWIKLYNDFCKSHNISISEPERFRKNVELKYLLRGIAKCCPWVHKLYIIVQDQSQIPEYVKESENLKIIYHKDIIPNQFLPTFNSNTIENFMPFIPGLSEQFININDDMIPLRPMEESDFFDENGYPRLNIKYKFQSPSHYRIALKGTEKFIRTYMNHWDDWLDNNFYIRNEHSWHAQLKSDWMKIWDDNKNKLMGSITSFRSVNNIVQPNAVEYYEYFQKRISPQNLTLKYTQFNRGIKNIENALNSNPHIICINDVRTHEFQKIVDYINSFLLTRYPHPCKYEVI